MTDEERRLLVDLLGQLQQIRAVQKDPEADGMIQPVLQRQPDAGYLLIQKALLQDRALAAARGEIARLQAQLADMGRAGGFLANSAWGPGAASGGVPAPSAGPWREPAPAAPPGRSMAGGMGSFLGTAVTTAAGVAAGAFLFQGLEGLLGHHDGRGGTGLLGDDRPDPDRPARHEQLADGQEAGGVDDGALSGLGPDDDGSFDSDGSGTET